MISYKFLFSSMRSVNYCGELSNVYYFFGGFIVFSRALLHFHWRLELEI
jgi:hypothetical protein